MAAHVGARISHNSHIGTIRFVGQVDHTPGTWIGVEWDDPTRGKHDGSKDGKRYFSCRSSTAGSFIRPTPNVRYPMSFLEALTARYVEDLHGSRTLEKVLLGSSAGAIQVEAVALDKIRQKFARLDQLRNASLDNACVGRADPPGHILKTCPNIRRLDLSKNLFQTWLTISDIAKELPFLRSLSLNRNRLPAPSSADSYLAGSFEKLEELQLNDTLCSWHHMQILTLSMPFLKSVELGYNQLLRLSTEDDTPAIPPHPTLHTLNLDSNLLSDWTHICASIAAYKRYPVALTISAEIQADSIQTTDIAEHYCSLSSLEHLSLSENRIASWPSLDALSVWIPNLKSLSIRGNPLVNGNDERHARSHIIARISSLVTLDGTRISSRERTDSELYYMSFIIQQRHLSEEERRKEHRRWAELCDAHGKPTEVQDQSILSDKLSNRLIDLELYPYPDPEPSDTLDGSKSIVLRVLPTLSLRVLRTKICKALKYDIRRTKIRCWLRTTDNRLLELESTHDTKEIDWLGVENGSQIVYQISLYWP